MTLKGCHNDDLNEWHSKVAAMITLKRMTLKGYCNDET